MHMIITKRTIMQSLRLWLCIACMLTIIGCIFIYSASSVYALEKFGSGMYFLVRQLVGFALGIIGIVIIQWIPPDAIKKASPFVLLISFILTMLSFIAMFARRVHGASRWVHLGPLAFQPSEMLKMALIVYLAYILSKKDWSQASFVHDYLPLLIIMGIPCIAILAQPDFGQTVTLGITIFFMLFVASVKISHLLLSLLVLLPAGIVMILFKSYRLKRILIFLNPWEDPLGSGFQIIQSLIAIGSGNLWGLGIGNSRQKFFYLPMQHTDFIFSVIAEETGFIGAVIIVCLYGAFLYLGLRMACRMQDRFTALVLVGFSMVTALQALINIAVATGLVPTKGIGLPFVSYGNTALVCNLLMVGIIINLVRHHAYENPLYVHAR